MPDQFTRCKTYGHAWFEADSDWKSTMGVPITLRCERCMTERRDVYSRSTGDLVYRHYIYPEGYADHWKIDGVRLTKNDHRLALLALKRRENRRAAG